MGFADYRYYLFLKDFKWSSFRKGLDIGLPYTSIKNRKLPRAIKRITNSWGQLTVIEKQGVPAQNGPIVLKGVFKKHRGPSGLIGTFQGDAILPHVSRIEFTILAEGAGYGAKVSIAKHAGSQANIARILHFFKELRVAQD